MIEFRLNPEMLQDISRESGVTIVAGTGYYWDHFIPADVKNMSIEQAWIDLFG